jgi:plastocyanin
LLEASRHPGDHAGMSTTETPTLIDDPDAMRVRARWSRLASSALLVAAVGPMLMFAASLIWGLDVGDATFFAVGAVLAFAGALLLRSRRTVARVLGLIVALLVGMMLFWTAFGLATPDSFFDFVPGVLVIPGALTAIVAGIAAIRAQRRGDLVPSSGAGERKAMTVGAALIVVLAVASAALTLTGRDTVDAAEADVTIAMSDFEFEADGSEIALSAGDVVLVRNDDPFHHTFTIEELDIDLDMGPGSEELVTIPDDASGGYVLYCEPHTNDPEDPSDDDMAARIRID